VTGKNRPEKRIETSGFRRILRTARAADKSHGCGDKEAANEKRISHAFSITAPAEELQVKKVT